jgi:hypothetical protein
MKKKITALKLKPLTKKCPVTGEPHDISNKHVTTKVVTKEVEKESGSSIVTVLKEYVEAVEYTCLACGERWYVPIND